MNSWKGEDFDWGFVWLIDARLLPLARCLQNRTWTLGVSCIGADEVQTFVGVGGGVGDHTYLEILFAFGDDHFPLARF